MQSIQSRLKSRRILGVGEGADGQQHRSKITQILGNDSLTNWQIGRAEYPIGLHALQWLTCLWFAAVGLTSLCAPKFLLPAVSLSAIDSLVSEISQSAENNDNLLTQLGTIQGTMVAEVRMYGAAMLGLASLCVIVTFANGKSRRAIRIVLLVEGIFCASELTAALLSTTVLDFERVLDNVQQSSILCNSVRALVMIASLYYFARTAPEKQYVTKRVD